MKDIMNALIEMEIEIQRFCIEMERLERENG
jgi:hypothetical protein